MQHIWEYFWSIGFIPLLASKSEAAQEETKLLFSGLCPDSEISITTVCDLFFLHSSGPLVTRVKPQSNRSHVTPSLLHWHLWLAYSPPAMYCPGYEFWWLDWFTSDNLYIFTIENWEEIRAIRYLLSQTMLFYFPWIHLQSHRWGGHPTAHCALHDGTAWRRFCLWVWWGCPHTASASAPRLG